MSAQLLFQQSPTMPSSRAGTCPLDANCSCALHPAKIVDADAPFERNAEVRDLLDRGWVVESATDDEVVLSKRRGIQSLCVNFVLTMVTALVWLVVWIPNARHPRVDRRTIVLAAGPVIAQESFARPLQAE